MCNKKESVNRVDLGNYLFTYAYCFSLKYTYVLNFNQEINYLLLMQICLIFYLKQ